MPKQKTNQLWYDHNKPVDERTAALVGAMSLREKIAQMVHHAPPIPRLGVPEYNWWNECLHGVDRAGKATVFPQAVARESMVLLKNGGVLPRRKDPGR